MFELGQTVFYDIRIFSLRKSAFIDFFFSVVVLLFSFLFFSFFYKRMRTTLLPAIMGVGG